MIYFTPEELCTIEMLTYFNEVKGLIYNAVGLSDNDDNSFSTATEGKTIGYILRKFDTDKIMELKATPHKDCTLWGTGAAETQSDFSSDCIEILKAYWSVGQPLCQLR